MPTTLLGERDDVVLLVFGDECLFETAKAVDGLLAQMEQQGVAFWDRELAQGLEADLLSFDREKRSIPGIHNSTRRKVLIEQLLESVRRVKYVEVIRTLKLSNRRADPVLSKNTNELKTGAPGRFGSEASEAWLANGS